MNGHHTPAEPLQTDHPQVEDHTRSSSQKEEEQDLHHHRVDNARIVDNQAPPHSKVVTNDIPATLPSIGLPNKQFTRGEVQYYIMTAFAFTFEQVQQFIAASLALTNSNALLPCDELEHWSSWTCSIHEEQRHHTDQAIKELTEIGFNHPEPFVENVGTLNVLLALAELYSALSIGTRIRNKPGFVRDFVTKASAQ